MGKNIKVGITKLKIIADTHMHTIACSHAYSTLNEMVMAAAQKGLSFVAITEHGCKLADAPYVWHFKNMPNVIPDVLHGVIVLKGCEVNIIDNDGGIDMDETILKNLDWKIASMHNNTYAPSTIENHTKAWLSIAKNPLIDVIGHCGNEEYLFDYEKGIKAFKEYGKIVEINSYSFKGRKGSDVNCAKIANLCKKYEVPIVVNSDAHFLTYVGEHSAAINMLEEIDFPEKLIINADYDRFLEIARKKSGRKLV